MFTTSWYLQKYKREFMDLGKLCRENSPGIFAEFSWLYSLQVAQAERERAKGVSGNFPWIKAEKKQKPPIVNYEEWGSSLSFEFPQGL